MSTVATLGVEDAATHAVMLLDPQRMDAYVEAIAEVVRPGDVVVDVGAGSGILAMLAARAGARRVFAIERASVAHLARRLIEENRLQGVIEVIRADARELTLPEPATVLLSETMGNLGVDEGLLALFATLARQCTPDARVIPSVVEPVLALVEDPALASELVQVENLRGLTLGALRRSLAHRVLSCRLSPEHLASAPVAAGSFRAGLDPLPPRLTARLVATRGALLNGVGAWFRAQLSPRRWLDSGPLAPPTHWGHFLFPLDPPLPCAPGEVVEISITPRLLPSLSLWSWSARCGPHQRHGDALQAFLGDARDVAAQLAPPPSASASSPPSPGATPAPPTPSRSSGPCSGPPPACCDPRSTAERLGMSRAGRQMLGWSVASSA
ncbi:MAG: 50S ribosomal protein L11 methyltransferase [Polyangiaceae bacterium]|nr:50S ribosomal protein L11 methyltransferase [Polyangiaceae bacterium]